VSRVERVLDVRVVGELRASVRCHLVLQRNGLILVELGGLEKLTALKIYDELSAVGMDADRIFALRTKLGRFLKRFAHCGCDAVCPHIGTYVEGQLTELERKNQEGLVELWPRQLLRPRQRRLHFVTILWLQSVAMLSRLRQKTDVSKEPISALAVACRLFTVLQASDTKALSCVSVANSTVLARGLFWEGFLGFFVRRLNDESTRFGAGAVLAWGDAGATGEWVVDGGVLPRTRGGGYFALQLAGRVEAACGQGLKDGRRRAG
jgi:hypothetical protein